METLYKKLKTLSVDNEQRDYLLKLNKKKAVGLYKNKDVFILYDKIDSIIRSISELKDIDPNDYNKIASELKEYINKLIEDIKDDKNFVIYDKNVLSVHKNCIYNDFNYTVMNGNQFVFSHNFDFFKNTNKNKLKKFNKRIEKILSNFNDIEKSVNDKKYVYRVFKDDDDNIYYCRCYCINGENYVDMISATENDHIYIDLKSIDEDNLIENGFVLEEKDFNNVCKEIIESIRSIMVYNCNSSHVEHIDNDTMCFYVLNKINDVIMIELNDKGIYMSQEHNDTDNKSKKVSKFIKKLSKLADDI